MRATIDKAGRLVVPKALRDELGLLPGQELELTARDGKLEAELPPVGTHVEVRGGIPVAVPDEDIPPLTAVQVRETLERVRR